MVNLSRATAVAAFGLCCLLVPGDAGVAQLPTAAEVTIPWTSAEGAGFEVRVPADEWRRFDAVRRRRLAADHERLRSMSDTMIALEVAGAFLRVSERVPVYTDWVYGWLESYVATYLVADRAIELWLGLAKGREALPFGAAVSEGLHEVVGKHFNEMVVVPAAIDETLDVAIRRTGATLHEEWRRVVARDRRDLDSFVARYGGSAVAVAAPDPACSSAALGLPPIETTGDVATERLQPDQSDLFAMRFARPYAARVTIIGMRVLSGGSVFATAGAFGLGLGAGPVAAAITATAAIWSLDYLVNRVDAVSHRGEFEERLVAAVAETQRQITVEIGEHAASLLDRARDRLDRCGGARS